MSTAVSIQAAITLTGFSAGLPRIKAFTVFLLALRFFALAHFFCCSIFGAMFSHGPSIFYLLSIAWDIRTFTTGAFLGAHFPTSKALTIKFNAACFLAHAPCLFLLFRSFEAVRCFHKCILVKCSFLRLMQMLNGGRVFNSWFMAIQFHIFDGPEGRNIRFGDNEAHLIGEHILVFHHRVEVFKRWKTVHDTVFYDLLEI